MWVHTLSALCASGRTSLYGVTRPESYAFTTTGVKLSVNGAVNPEWATPVPSILDLTDASYRTLSSQGTEAEREGEGG